jgi:hypothetical protein
MYHRGMKTFEQLSRAIALVLTGTASMSLQTRGVLLKNQQVPKSPASACSALADQW